MRDIKDADLDVKNSRGFVVLPGPWALTIMNRLVADRHCGIFDAQGDPYFMHCDKVMHYVRKFNPDDYERMAGAKGHDLIEDTKTTYTELYNVGLVYPEFDGYGFSDRVVDMIRALTNVAGETEEEKMERILANLDACIIKAIGDLRHNTDIRRGKGVRPQDFERLEKYHRRYKMIKEHVKTKYGIIIY